MGRERLIEVMNDLVAVEIAAVTEYQQHAYLSENPRLADLLEDFSMDEMSHIEWCSREVVRLGGVPTVLPKEIKPVEKTAEALIRRDIEVEADAMRRLKEYIKVAEEEGERSIVKLLREIHDDEATHYDLLSRLLNPPKNALGRIKGSIDIGAGLILTGLFWLYFWLGPWFVFYESDPRWAHNFAFPLTLIVIGVACKGQKLSTDLVAVFTAFMIIPTEAGIVSGTSSTYIAVAALLVMLLLLIVEAERRQELLFLTHRWRRWFKKHLLIFAFLFLMHMSFIFFFTRMFEPEVMGVNLPPEPPWVPEHWATASYNLLVIPFGLLGMAERFRGTLRRRITISKLGYWWSLMIIIIGVAVAIIAEASARARLMYAVPLIAAVAVLAVSLTAHKKG